LSTVLNLSIEIPESNSQRSFALKNLQATKKPNLAPIIKADTPIRSALVLNVGTKLSLKSQGFSRTASVKAEAPFLAGGLT